MLKGYPLLSLLAASVALVSCGEYRSYKNYRSDPNRDLVQASLLVSDSFYIESAESGAGVVQPRMAILESALDREFLLQASMVRQVPMQMWTGLHGRVVSFKRRGDMLYMMDATGSHGLIAEIEQRLVLAAFPILEVKDERVFFDFNVGMSRLFLANSWYASDLLGAGYREDLWNMAPLEVSFVDHLEFVASDRLLITQVAQLRGNPSTSRPGLALQPLILHYYLTPYVVNEGFLPTRSPSKEHVGFFEVSPKVPVGGGDGVVHAVKFDHRKPIVFAISDNTPPEFRDAVRDGIRYWNRAFGREVLQAVDAPEGERAPSYRHNMVQWIDLDSAGMAYADMQMDPRTGEVLHGQVYLTSAFAFLGAAHARDYLRRERSSHDALVTDYVRLKGFESSVLCQFSLQDQFSEALELLLDTDPSDEQILKLSQDYVRYVTAHEVGHILGLRHNFAGSLAANYPPSALPALFKEYVTNQKAPTGIVASSSVMEYTSFTESVMMSDKMIYGTEIPSYDRMAIRHVYLGEELPATNRPLFCTDSHAMVNPYVDCVRGDSGPSVVESQFFQVERSLETLAHRILNLFINAKAPTSGFEPIPLSQVALNPQTMATSILAPRATMLQAMQDDAKFIAIWRQHPQVGPLNLAEVKAERDHYLLEEFTRLGGVERLLRSIRTAEVQDLHRAFLALIERPDIRQGVARSGAAYQFSHRDLALIEAMAGQFFNLLPEALVAAELKLHNDTSDLAAGELTQNYAEFLLDLAQNVILKSQDTILVEVMLPAETAAAAGEAVNSSENGASPSEPELVSHELHLPVYLYPHELRLAAAKLLATGRVKGDPSWGLSELETLKQALDQHLVEVLGRKPAGLDPAMWPRPAAKWLLENRAIVAALRRS